MLALYGQIMLPQRVQPGKLHTALPITPTRQHCKSCGAQLITPADSTRQCRERALYIALQCVAEHAFALSACRKD